MIRGWAREREKKKKGSFLCLPTKEFHSIRADRSFELNTRRQVYVRTLDEFSFSLFPLPRWCPRTRTTIRSYTRPRVGQTQREREEWGGGTVG